MGEGGAFMPLQISCKRLNLVREVYRQKTLDRKESIDGSIFFEVPDVMLPF